MIPFLYGYWSCHLNVDTEDQAQDDQHLCEDRVEKEKTFVNEMKA